MDVAISSAVIEDEDDDEVGELEEEFFIQMKKTMFIVKSPTTRCRSVDFFLVISSKIEIERSIIGHTDGQGTHLTWVSCQMTCGALVPTNGTKCSLGTPTTMSVAPTGNASKLSLTGRMKIVLSGMSTSICITSMRKKHNPGQHGTE